MSDAAEEDKGLESFEPRRRPKKRRDELPEAVETECEPMPETRADRDERLNAQYREEGWGQITDRVFAGVDPIDVESAARDVARFAYDMELNHQKQLADSDDALGSVNDAKVALEQQLDYTRASHIVNGLLKDCEIQALTRDKADDRLDMLQVKLWFARARAQGLDVPEGLSEMELQAWRPVK